MVFLLFIGYVKYKKEEKNNYTIKTQKTNLDIAINQINSAKIYYDNLFKKQVANDNMSLSGQKKRDSAIIIAIQDAFRKQKGLFIDRNYKIHAINGNFTDNSAQGIVLEPGSHDNQIHDNHFLIAPPVKKNK